MCAECDYQVLPERCHVFVFAHIDAATKTKSVAQLCNQHNTLKTAQTGLEEEMAKCRLLCAVCHSKETRDRNTRSPERRGQASSSVYDLLLFFAPFRRREPLRVKPTPKIFWNLCNVRIYLRVHVVVPVPARRCTCPLVVPSVL